MARPSILVALVLFSIIACIQGKPKGHDSVNKNENTNELLRRSFNNGSNTNSLSSQTPKTPRSGNNLEKINTAAVTARASHDETSESTTADNTMTKTPIERSDSVVTDADAEALELKKTKDLIKALNEASGDKLSKENALALITAMGSLLEKLDNATKTGQIARRDYNKNINKNTFKPRMPIQYVNPQPLGIDTSNLARQNINQRQASENKTDAVEGDSRTDQDNDSHDADDNEDDGEDRSEDHSEDDSKRDNEDRTEDDSKRDNEDHTEDDSKRDNEDHSDDDSKRDNDDHSEDDSKRDNEDHSEDDSKRDNEDHSEDDSKRDNEDHSEDDSTRDNEDHSEDDSTRDNEDHSEDDSKRDNEDHAEDHSKDHSEVSEGRSEHQSDEGEDSSRQEDHHEDDDSDESSDESPESGRLLVNENFNYNKNVNQFGLQGKKDDEYYKNLFRRRLTNNIQGLESSKKNLNHLRRGVNINENTNDLPYLESRRNIGSNEESRENFSKKVGNIDKDFSKIMNTKKDSNVNYNENLNLFRPANSGLAPHRPS